MIRYYIFILFVIFLVIKKCIHFLVQEVISKWRSVRDNYTRSLKKQAECNKSGSGVKKIQRYIFEQQLSFLKKCREQRPTCSSIQIHEQTNEDTPRSDFDDIESNINNNTQCTENEGNQNDTSISQCHKSTPAKKRKTTHSLEDKLGAFLDSRTINMNSSSVDMTDEDMAFYTSTLPIVKTLTLNQKMRFRIEVMQLLQNIKHTGSSMESSIDQTSYVAPYRHHNMPISSHTYNDQYLQSNILRPNSASSSNSIQTYYTQFSPEDQNPPSNQSTSDGFI